MAPTPCCHGATCPHAATRSHDANLLPVLPLTRPATATAPLPCHNTTTAAVNPVAMVARNRLARHLRCAATCPFCCLPVHCHSCWHGEARRRGAHHPRAHGARVILGHRQGHVLSWGGGMGHASSSGGGTVCASPSQACRRDHVVR
jgi:hypothetical protein